MNERDKLFRTIRYLIVIVFITILFLVLLYLGG